MDWKSGVQTALNETIRENGIPEQSILLIENKGIDKTKTTSYSICIYEPEYPLINDNAKSLTQSAIALKIEEKKTRFLLFINNVYFDQVDAPEDAEIRRISSDSCNVHVYFSKNSDTFISYLKQILGCALDAYESTAQAFGCCSKYEECSDAKHCLHENQLYSRACMYRKNLNAGRIFYGKNKNIN